jgi:hypothetical protein
MIQAIMLIALGFLAASLIGVLLAPSLWNRASRLTRKKLESTLPLTLAEIEAAQDQLRASYAVRLRRLETALASAKQKAANQLVDNSRLQMQIAALKEQIGDLDIKLSERRNAATVLEQTITKRFPELDREIAAVKTQLQDRSFELQDLTNKLARRDEELAGAQRAVASYEVEIESLRRAMEKGASDRGGRRVRKASQWDIEDYKAEYDRLNLEMSKLRQQLAHFQDRDAQQVGVIKGELQKLAELILASAQPKPALRPAEQRPEAFARRPAGYEGRKERPAPWRQGANGPAPLTARLQLAAEAQDAAPLAPPPPLTQERRSEAEIGAVSSSPVLSILPEKTVLMSTPKNGSAETGSRSKMLQEVVTQESPETPLAAERNAEPAPSPAPAINGAVAPLAPEREAGLREGPAGGEDFEKAASVRDANAPEAEAPQAPVVQSLGDKARAKDPDAFDGAPAGLSEAAPAPEIENARTAQAQTAEDESRTEDAKAASEPTNGHAAKQDERETASDAAHSLDPEGLKDEPELEKAGAAQPPSSLLERLRVAAEDAAEAKQ